jgi:glycosyltransferase involved in cell wall biosynthesis
MKKPLVIIPSYNTGAALSATVGDVLRHWAGPVWVVIDGSTDSSDAALERDYGSEKSLRIIRRPHNKGKGAAILLAADMALGENFTHGCTFDADGQHCAADIERMLSLVNEDGASFALGIPAFGPEAPAARVKGRRVGNTFARIETLWNGPKDSLYGMRVYPLKPLVRAMSGSWGGNRYDFDTEAAVKLTWRGVRPIHVTTPVKYPTKAEGGVSHFKYLRDNILLTAMHVRLLAQTPLHLPSLVANGRRWRRAATASEPSL